MISPGRSLRARFQSIPIPSLVRLGVATAVVIAAGCLMIAGLVFIREGLAPTSPGAWYPPSLVTNLWISGGTMVWLGYLVGKLGYRLVRDLTEAPRR